VPATAQLASVEASAGSRVESRDMLLGRAPQPGRHTSETNEAWASCYQRTGCLTCLDTLVEANEPLLHHTLRRFRSSNEPYEDLFQVARMGLLKAAQRYKPDRGTRFSTYATAIVDGEVRHYLRDSLLMRQPRWARRLYGEVERAQADFFRERGRYPTVSEIGEAINVREEGVTEILRVWAQLNIHSCDEPDVLEESPSVDRSLVRSARRESFSLPVEDRIALYDALSTLSELQRRIIYLVFFKDLTQQQVADEVGLNQRAVSREQMRALSRLKGILTKKVF